MDIAAIGANYITYVFGDPVLAALGFLAIITMIGIRYNWSLESFVMIYTPVIVGVLGFGVFGASGITVMWLMGLGLVIGMGMLYLLKAGR